MAEYTCPCCSHILKVEEIATVSADISPQFFLECGVCGLRTDSYETPVRAIEAWKSREFSNWTESAKSYYRRNYDKSRF